jgi:uncharacterized protein YndB with AHSA1/START domain
MANKNKTTIIAEPGKQEMRTTRKFDAPRELVFQAFTDPELYVQWLGPRRLTTMLDTFEFEGLPEAGHVALEMLTLEELPGGRTRLTAQSVFQSVTDRDGALQSGMEEGLNDSYERLTELLETM